MTSVFHRQLRGVPPVASRGDGIYIEDSSGKRYIDACGGAAVSCLGHGNREVAEAVKAQIDRLEYAHTSFFTTDAAEQLADALIADAPPGLASVYFVSGGSEGVEAALKMARQYFIEIGQPQRRHFIARRQSYHGNTLGALAVGGNAWRRQPFAPLLIDAVHVSPCFAYRFKPVEESEEAYGARLARELEDKIRELGPESVIGFVAETVGGATSGCVPPVPGYFRAVREVCDRHGVLLILDEVMCGMGRTGSLHACTQEGVAPDLMIVAKGLGAGYQPIGAVLVAQKIVDAIQRGSGFFQHGHTYLAHALSCAAALAVQRIIKRDGLVERVRTQGQKLASALNERFGNHRAVGDIRGRGLFQAIELVKDRSSKAPYDPAIKLNARIKQEAMARGLMVYPMGGTIDGRSGDHVLLAPPFTVTDEQIGAIVERLGDAVDAAVAGAAAS
ncbi:MAG TPA: aspartate aminotransferase family protein [Alphaproteobacteria bacterium]|nr:aspartate aminotransferase family protein [Alphaproteobacteria bacterium]